VVDLGSVCGQPRDEWIHRNPLEALQLGNRASGPPGFGVPAALRGIDRQGAEHSIGFHFKGSFAVISAKAENSPPKPSRQPAEISRNGRFRCTSPLCRGNRGDDRFTQATRAVASRNAIFEPFFSCRKQVEGREQHRAGDFNRDLIE